MTQKQINEVAKKVAQLLAENQVTLYDVPEIFRQSKRYMTVSSQRQNPDEEQNSSR